MDPHAGFVLAAYLAAALVMAALAAWVVLDHRTQARALAELEARGVTRRSDRPA
jgi:heme exporter protein D